MYLPRYVVIQACQLVVDEGKVVKDQTRPGLNGPWRRMSRPFRQRDSRCRPFPGHDLNFCPASHDEKFHCPKERFPPNLINPLHQGRRVRPSKSLTEDMGRASHGRGVCPPDLPRTVQGRGSGGPGSGPSGPEHVASARAAIYQKPRGPGGSCHELELGPSLFLLQEFSRLALEDPPDHN